MSHRVRRRFGENFFINCINLLCFILCCPVSFAFEIDWSGQFWSEVDIVANYNMDAQENKVDSTRMIEQPGYYIPPAGSSTAKFGLLFLRLRPKILVTDNIFIKSEIWFGNPAGSFFGDTLPYAWDLRRDFFNQSRGGILSAQRYWAELVTTVGTFQIGRLPVHWGLGLVWNSGEELFSRYMSTLDGARWLATFGSFSFSPSIFLSNAGNTIGGSGVWQNNQLVLSNATASGQMFDLSFLLKYENVDEKIEAGVNWMRRITAGGLQDMNVAAKTPLFDLGKFSINTSTWDIFVQKRFSKFKFSIEIPIVTGDLSSMDVSSYGLATESTWEWSESILLGLRAGFASGQVSQAEFEPKRFQLLTFHPNYRIANILFNYQLANFSQVQMSNNESIPSSSIAPIYFNPIQNALYLSFAPEFKLSQHWTLNPRLIWARALAVAKSGEYFFHSWLYKFVKNNTSSDQLANLGLEVDMNATYQWDDAAYVRFETGFFFPGKFYAFSNVENKPNQSDLVFAAAVKLGVNF